MATDRLDVLIVGAGYSGLACAHHLAKRQYRIVVLEASNRAGGRTLERLVQGQFRLELGGQYIAPDQKRVNRLIEEFGLKTFPAWGSGEHFLSLEDRTSLYQDSPIRALVEQGGVPNSVPVEIENALKKLTEMFPSIDPALPWKNPQAKEWDSLTFQSWLEQNLSSPLSRKFFRLMTNQGFSTEPEQISLLQMLWFFRTTHGLPPWALGGAQANRIVGGTQLLAERMAERLGTQVHYQKRVLSVQQNHQGVYVHTLDSHYFARAVVFCIPPQLIQTIHYEPDLPADLFRAFSAFQIGNAMKVQAVYKKPFWREKGLSGNGISFHGIPAFTFDNSSPHGTPGVLLGFLAASSATQWNHRPKEERKNALLQTWANVFGKEALEPDEYIEYDWSKDPFIRGGHGCHFPPGAWSELGFALGGDQLPHHGKILWAASDLAKDWNGYLEGALYAGEQAAEEVEMFIQKVQHAAIR